MKFYLVRMSCRSPYLTPWRSCTVWGRLSWIVASGAVPNWTIDDWLEYYREGINPLVVGDGLPYDAVPVPAGLLATAKSPLKPPKTLPWPQWCELCRTGIWPSESVATIELRDVERQHVKIDRARGAAIDGGLRTEKGLWPAGGIIMAVLIDDTFGIEAFERAIRILCTEGWGYGRNYGYGTIDLTSIESVERPSPTGCVVTLGHCHPTDDLPQEGYWRWTGVPVLAHDPESRRAILPRRFTTMLQPGATFPSTESYLGRILESSVPGNKNHLHNGIAPTWPVDLQEALRG